MNTRKWFIWVASTQKVSGPVNDKYLEDNYQSLVAQDADVYTRCLGEYWVSAKDYKVKLEEALARIEEARLNSVEKNWYIEKENKFISGPYSEDELKYQIAKIDKSKFDKVKLYQGNNLTPQSLFENTTITKDFGICQRKFKRIEVDLTAEIVNQGQSFKTKIVSLSEEGCGILLPESYLPTGTVQINILNFGYEGLLKLKGDFLYNKSTGSGFKFVNLGMLARTQIISYIRQELGGYKKVA